MAAGIQTGAKYVIIGGPRETPATVIETFDMPANAVVVRTNEVTNPKFQTNLSGWTNAGMGSATQENVPTTGGLPFGVLKSNHIISDGAGDIYQYFFTPVVGRGYRVSLYIRLRSATVANSSVVMRVRAPTPGNIVSTANFTPVAGNFTRLDLGFVATINELHHIRLEALSTLGGLLAGIDFDITAAMIESLPGGVIPALGTYFDGDAGASKWQGTVGLSMSDQYDRDALSEHWTANAGGGTLQTFNQDFVIPNTTAEKRYVYSSPIRNKRNFDVVMKFKVSNPANPNTSIILSRSNGVYIMARADGAGSTLRVEAVNPAQSLGGTVSTAFTAGTTYWLRLVKSGDTLWAEKWTADPALGGSPVASTPPTALSGTAADTFAYADLTPGIRLVPDASLTTEIYEYRVGTWQETLPTFETDPHGYPGTRVVLNDDTDLDYVGVTGGDDAITGLDSAEVAESFDENVESDGTAHGAFYERRRPFTLAVQIPPGVPATRTLRAGRFLSATKALRRGDASANEGVLIWQPAGYPEMWVPFRRQQPTRQSGLHIKTMLAALVAENPRIYSVELVDTGEQTPAFTATAGTTFDRAGNQIVQSWTGGAAQFLIDNDGDGVAPIIIRLVGPYTGIHAIQNNTTGEEIRIDTTLAAGDVMIIEPTKRQAYKESTGENYMDRIDIPKTRWWGLMPGRNDIRVAILTGGSSAATRFETTHRHVWS